MRVACKRLRDRSRHDPALARSLDRSFCFKQTERWGCSPPPWPTKLLDADLDAAAARLAASGARLPACTILARLRRTFRTRDREWKPTARGKGRCEYCVRDNRCGAVGCATRPSDCLGKSTGFRCLPGVHACNKHGLRVNVNNGRGATLHMKDGRTLSCVFDGVDGPRRKRRRKAQSCELTESQALRQQAKLRRAVMTVAALVSERAWGSRSLSDVLSDLPCDATTTDRFS